MADLTLAFGPSRKLAGATLVAAVLVAGAAVVSDAAGRLILGIAAVTLAGLAASDLLRSPRLSADRAGLQVGQERFGWSSVTVRVDQRSHLGQSIRALEVDDGERLIVLGRHSLGLDPHEVLLRLEVMSGRPLQHSRPPRDEDDHHGE